ncbi:hypothetical protein T07_4559 [Trichinella nelsoni]|uniref:Uncharacterized protein n=1 Tax=Trichinella nelsoni TaxID=6336 RepID=A0A0V0S4C2_9BILA|nr:hypothetical protein T07_4559 [Trichinella nelsoni]
MGFFARLDKKDAGNKLGFYKLLQLLIEEHGEMEALINQMLSGDTVAVDLRWINRQPLVIRYTGDCTNGRHTLEQFFEALMYLAPEQISCCLQVPSHFCLLSLLLPLLLIYFIKAHYDSENQSDYAKKYNEKWTSTTNNKTPWKNCTQLEHPNEERWEVI